MFRSAGILPAYSAIIMLMPIRKVFVTLISLILLTTGCGRKGDPVRPEIPKPNPLRNVSASVTDDAIVLSWNAPDVYNTGKPLDVMRDIQTITISRKQESSTDQLWDFSLSRDGWNALGQTLPVKWSQGTVRAASQGTIAGMVSPENLALSASQYRYIALSLWTRSAERAYLMFLTSDDAQWDLEPDFAFNPAVHTSLLSYQRAFAARKMKALPLLPQPASSIQARDYLLDMHEVPAWTGTIQQVGVVVSRSTPGTGELEVGLERLSLMDTKIPPATLYDAPPWGFWQDEEGWRVESQNTIAGAAGGVLYLKSGAEPVLIASAVGQQIPWNHVRYVQIRMQNTTRKHAYVLFRGAQDPPFEKRSAVDLTAPSSMVLPVVLQPSDDFQVYTIACPDFSDNVGVLSQIGLYFPEQQDDQMRLDYIAPARSHRVAEALAPLLLQKNIPALLEVAQQVQRQQANRNPGFDVGYNELGSDGEVFRGTELTLVRVSPHDPAPVVIHDDGGFTFYDTGIADGGDGEAVPLKRGERYTYTVKLIDKKEQVSAVPETISVNVPYIPSAPLFLGATAGDREVHLTWNRPFLDTHGGKLRAFDGYHIYRSTVPGQYGGAPVHQTAANDTAFVDTNVVNGTMYYYVVRAVSSVTNTTVAGETSLEVSATPGDTQAPNAPNDLTSAYLAGIVKLFWNFSTSQDWKGFNVYRGLSAEGPFQQINPQPVLLPAYDDTTTRPNQQYFYYITSIDTAQPPNESLPSNTIQVTTVKR